MATQTQVIFIDDLDESPAIGTTRFGLDGAEYEIDLNAEHDAAIREILARYVAAARRAAPPNGKARTSKGRKGSGRVVPAAHFRSAADPDKRAQIRAWAKQQPEFAEISDRGRIASNVVVAYNRAHGLGS